MSVICPLQVFNWRVVDCDLAIALCTLLSKPEVFKILWKVIDNTWQNYDKILVGIVIFWAISLHVTDLTLPWEVFCTQIHKEVLNCVYSTCFKDYFAISQGKTSCNLFGVKEVHIHDCTYPSMWNSANLISVCLLIISGCGQYRGQSVLLVQWGRGTREVSLCHHWCWVGHQAWQTGGLWMKACFIFLFTLDFSWLGISPCFCPRYRSSRCSVSGLKWRVVWSLIWWKTGRSLQTLFFSTAGQPLIHSVEHFCFTVHHSLLLPVLKVSLCFHLQHLRPWPWRRDQPIHYHLTAAPRGRGSFRRPGHRPGRDAAFVSCGRTGASPADYPDITQHQWTHRKSLCCHIQGLCKEGGQARRWWYS